MRRPSNDSAPTKASSPGEIANSSSSAGPTLPGPAPASLPVLLPVSSPVPVSAPAPVSPFGPVDPADLRRWTSRWSRVASSGVTKRIDPSVLEPPAVSRSTAATPSARWITLRLTSTFWIRR